LHQLSRFLLEGHPREKVGDAILYRQVRVF
jgi:hypothetical protein